MVGHRPLEARIGVQVPVPQCFDSVAYATPAHRKQTTCYTVPQTSRIKVLASAAFKNCNAGSPKEMAFSV